MRVDTVSAIAAATKGRRLAMKLSQIDLDRHLREYKER